MAWGAHRDWLLALAEEGETPKALASMPEIREELLLVWDAFFELTTDRQIGFAAGPIPFTAVDRYATRMRIDGDTFEEFLALIRDMDGAYLDEMERRRKR